MKKTLETLRKDIDAIDDEIIVLLAKRMDRVREVGKYKALRTIKPLDEKRWQSVLQSITAKAKKLHLSEELVKNIYKSIHKSALLLEESL